MNGVRENIALPLAFVTSIGLLILLDYWSVYALAAGMDLVRWLFG